MGEFFGVPRHELLAFFPEGTRMDSKFHRVDWEPFAAMTERICAEIGEREDLIAAGQRYTYERIGTRFTHLMTQFGGGWDRVLWATKHFFSPRLIKGYVMEYRKLGDHHFELSSSIPDNYVGCEPYFWLFAGVWTGGNKISNLKHEILSLEVHPHGSRGEIRFARRNRASKVAFNSPWSRLKTWRDLKTNAREQQLQVEVLQLATHNLQHSVQAVSDAVYRIRQDTLVAENSAARTLQASADFDPEPLRKAALASPDTLKIGNRILEVRTPPRETEDSGHERLLVLRDRTEEIRLRQEAESAPERVRKQTGEKVSTLLGQELESVSTRIRSFLAEHPDDETAESLQRLEVLADQCRLQAKALVNHNLQQFEHQPDWRKALQELQQEYQDLYDFQIRIEGRLHPEPEDREGWSAWYLLCKEAFRNAYRHSGGSRVTLEMRPGQVRILDDGQGLREACEAGRGLGCDSMRDRAADLGWSMSPAPAPENGWILTRPKREG